MSDKYPESVAKLVLEKAFPGSRMVPVINQPNMEYDFDWHYVNGEVAAVEVTSSRNQNLTQIHAEIRKGGQRIRAILCNRLWFISPRPNANIKKIRTGADKYLSALEKAGIEHFGRSDYLKSNCHPSVVEICKDLNLCYAHSFPRNAGINITGVNSGGFCSSRSATEAGEKEIEPNRAKLRRAATKERHLVVYIDQSNILPWTAMTDFPQDIPKEPPELPKEVTRLWLIAQAERDRYVVWTGTASEAWQALTLQEKI